MLVSSNLRIVHALNASATPFSFDQDSLTHTGAIYDADRQRIDLSERIGGHRGGRIVSASPWSLQPKRHSWTKLPGRALYLGHWMVHYGHWLLESTSALWAVDRLAFDHVVFHPFKFGNARLDYMRPFLAAHGIDMAKIILIERPYQMDYVAVPERSYVPSYSAHETEFRRPLDRLLDYVGRSGNHGRKVFVSRSRLRRRPREPNNRQEVDDLAESLGFEVIYPETVSLEDQLKIYQETEVLCGFNGSALHNVLFMKGGKLIEIGDRLRANQGPFTQRLCNQVSGTAHHFISYTEAGGGRINLSDLGSSLREALSRSITLPLPVTRNVWHT